LYFTDGKGSQISDHDMIRNIFPAEEPVIPTEVNLLFFEGSKNLTADKYKLSGNNHE
jgi:hypothetical protein